MGWSSCYAIVKSQRFDKLNILWLQHQNVPSGCKNVDMNHSLSAGCEKTRIRWTEWWPSRFLREIWSLGDLLSHHLAWALYRCFNAAVKWSIFHIQRKITAVDAHCAFLHDAGVGLRDIRRECLRIFWDFARRVKAWGASYASQAEP